MHCHVVEITTACSVCDVFTRKESDEFQQCIAEKSKDGLRSGRPGAKRGVGITGAAAGSTTPPQPGPGAPQHGVPAEGVEQNPGRKRPHDHHAEDQKIVERLNLGLLSGRWKSMIFAEAPVKPKFQPMPSKISDSQ